MKSVHMLPSSRRLHCHDKRICLVGGQPRVAKPVRPTATATADAVASLSTRDSKVARDMSGNLSLAGIRNSLIRQEDTIIFNLIERAQFAKNDAVYGPGAIPVPASNVNGRSYSLLEYVLRETERLHASVRRYTSPDEHPFFPDEVTELMLPPLDYPHELAPCAQYININDTIIQAYVSDVLPGMTTPGDDNNYGSAATLDVLCLQALSKRIHYGKFVAEAKFREAPDKYSALIHARDVTAIMDLLTDRAVEQKVLERVRRKAATFGRDISATNSIDDGEPSYKILPEFVDCLYRDLVIPLTKEVEVQYLLARLQA